MTPLRVLIVEDTDHVRKMLTSMLTIDGFDVLGASRGQEAVDAVTSYEPDVVVLDFKMPEMDGVEAARRIAAARPGQPMLLYTAFVDDELVQSATAAGVSVCLDKVHGLSALELEIRRLAGEV